MLLEIFVFSKQLNHIRHIPRGIVRAESKMSQAVGNNFVRLLLNLKAGTSGRRAVSTHRPISHTRSRKARKIRAKNFLFDRASGRMARAIRLARNVTISALNAVPPPPLRGKSASGKGAAGIWM